MSEIVVKLSIDDFPKGWQISRSVWEWYVISQLKKAGVPIDGVLVFRALKQGTIYRCDDPNPQGKED